MREQLNRKLGQIFRNEKYSSILFFAIMFAAALLYNYQEIITYRPTSIHQWRNCVSASMALNYAEEGAFFQPRTHNLQADQLTSDVSVVEFPLIYYVIGMLYRIFGPDELIYRLVHLLIGFTGLFFLFRLGYRIFSHPLPALVPPLVIFSSPIYVYYINNFIPDAPALSIVFIAFYYFYRYYEKGTSTLFVVSMLFFAIAGLIKTPAFLLFFAILGIYLLETVFKVPFKTAGKIFSGWKWQGAVMLLVIVLAAGWYAYARIITDLHGGVVSEVEIRPIWILSSETINDTWKSIGDRFRTGQYHSPWFLALAGILLIHNLVFWKKYNRLFSWLSVLLFIGALSFSLLFYRSLRNHDYYQINNLVLLVMVLLNFFLYLQHNHTGILSSFIFRTFLAAAMIFLVFSCRSLMVSHYYNSWFEWNARQRYNNKYDEITPYLRSLGIKRSDPVYCTPDPSINISLYLMDQKGYTDFFRKNESFSEKLELFSTAGAKYLVLGEPEAIDGDPSDYRLEKIGEKHGVQIFKIPEL